jgi:hypothetical protein
MFNVSEWSKVELITGWDAQGNAVFNPNYKDFRYINNDMGLYKDRVTFTKEQQIQLEEFHGFRAFLERSGNYAEL